MKEARTGHRQVLEVVVDGGEGEEGFSLGRGDDDVRGGGRGQRHHLGERQFQGGRHPRHGRHPPWVPFPCKGCPGRIVTKYVAQLMMFSQEVNH
ncbi:hypothetical protein E2C01_045552 [Portunus trituberculatus]|uniref:Uncharacterized protein n=1 Tax=Portunus trituberculatus TaxID=210409 RepID=A0A5B7FW27_PORTR|nr:hypothetical protein [Portunus trituberculatus]